MKTLTVGQFFVALKRAQERRQSAQPFNRNPLDEVLVIVCAMGLLIVVTRLWGII